MKQKNVWIDEEGERFIALIGQRNGCESESQVSLVPLRAEDVAEFDLDADAPEMHDRIVTGLARRLKVGLISVDRKIAGHGKVEIVW